MSRYETQEAVEEPTNRFRPVYRKLDPKEQQLMTDIKTKAEELARLMEQARPVPSRYTALAIVNLEQSVMWAIKELTS